MNQTLLHPAASERQLQPEPPRVELTFERSVSLLDLTEDAAYPSPRTDHGRKRGGEGSTNPQESIEDHYKEKVSGGHSQPAVIFWKWVRHYIAGVSDPSNIMLVGVWGRLCCSMVSVDASYSMVLVGVGGGCAAAWLQ